MSYLRCAATVAVVAAAFLFVPADASAKQCRPGGHLHHGTSDSMPSKEDARRDAIASWASFTQLEYGPGWSDFRNARYKKVSCYSRESGWACNVEGNPCRGRLRRSARK